VLHLVAADAQVERAVLGEVLRPHVFALAAPALRDAVAEEDELARVALLPALGEQRLVHRQPVLLGEPLLLLRRRHRRILVSHRGSVVALAPT